MPTKYYKEFIGEADEPSSVGSFIGQRFRSGAAQSPTLGAWHLDSNPALPLTSCVFMSLSPIASTKTHRMIFTF